jgi:hypothetical protein
MSVPTHTNIFYGRFSLPSRIYMNFQSFRYLALSVLIIPKFFIILRQLMDGRMEWKDTPSETLEKLEEIAEEENINTNQKKWPGGPQWVKRRLNEVKANLEESGLDVSYPREGDSGQRKIHLEWNNDVSDVSSDSENDTTDDTDSNQRKKKRGLRHEILEELEGEMEYQELIENLDRGSDSKIEKAIENLRNEGEIFDPRAGKIKKL